VPRRGWSVKRPKEVGRDFDRYAEDWDRDRYRMESGGDSAGPEFADNKQIQVRHAGDEWGELDKLRTLYRPLFQRLLPGASPVNIMEIGAGGGRSTQAVCDVLGDRIGDYHVVDVSRRFTDILEERIARPVTVHIVDDVDLSDAPGRHFDLCLAQSSWSHISVYDQFRYLRELRRVLRHGAPVVVHGIFLLGQGDDWTWNRFRRRVYQIDHQIEGVYHEFTGVAVIAEQLLRLEYNIEAIAGHGFVARSGQANSAANVGELAEPVSFPAFRSLAAFADGDPPRRVCL
jgi:SAM-dependent methyltransferase